MSNTAPNVTARAIVDTITHDAIEYVTYSPDDNESTVTFIDDTAITASEHCWDDEVTEDNVNGYSWVIHSPGDDPLDRRVASSNHGDDLRDAIIEHADTIINHDRTTEKFTPLVLPTAQQVIESVNHKAIDSVKATHDGHIVRLIDGSYISASHYTKGEVRELYPEIEDEDSEQWEEPAGYNWVYVMEGESPNDAYPDSDDNPAALKGAIIRAADDLLGEIIRAADDALKRRPWPHTQVLTTTVVSDHGDSATVSWVPEEVTGYDQAKVNLGMRTWAWDWESEAPVYWKLDPDTHTYNLEERIVQFTGTTQLTLSAHKVDNEDELKPGTYWVHP